MYVREGGGEFAGDSAHPLPPPPPTPPHKHFFLSQFHDRKQQLSLLSRYNYPASQQVLQAPNESIVMMPPPDPASLSLRLRCLLDQAPTSPLVRRGSGCVMILSFCPVHCSPLATVFSFLSRLLPFSVNLSGGIIGPAWLTRNPLRFQ